MCCLQIDDASVAASEDGGSSFGPSDQPPSAKVQNSGACCYAKRIDRHQLHLLLVMVSDARESALPMLCVRSPADSPQHGLPLLTVFHRDCTDGGGAAAAGEQLDGSAGPGRRRRAARAPACSSSTCRWAFRSSLCVSSDQRALLLPLDCAQAYS